MTADVRPKAIDKSDLAVCGGQIRKVTEAGPEQLPEQLQAALIIAQERQLADHIVVRKAAASAVAELAAARVLVAKAMVPKVMELRVLVDLIQDQVRAEVDPRLMVTRECLEPVAPKMVQAVTLSLLRALVQAPLIHSQGQRASLAVTTRVRKLVTVATINQLALRVDQLDLEVNLVDPRVVLMVPIERPEPVQIELDLVIIHRLHVDHELAAVALGPLTDRANA